MLTKISKIILQLALVFFNHASKVVDLVFSEKICRIMFNNSVPKPQDQNLKKRRKRKKKSLNLNHHNLKKRWKRKKKSQNLKKFILINLQTMVLKNAQSAKSYPFIKWMIKFVWKTTARSLGKNHLKKLKNTNAQAAAQKQTQLIVFVLFASSTRWLSCWSCKWKHRTWSMSWEIKNE